MHKIPIVEKKRYILANLARMSSKQEIAETGKRARSIAFRRKKPLVLDFRNAELDFDHEDVLQFFNQYYESSEQLLKFVYVAHWFNRDSPYLREIDQEWLDKGISTCPFSEARDIIRWINELEIMRKL